jgi:hypothetical protein
MAVVSLPARILDEVQAGSALEEVEQISGIERDLLMERVVEAAYHFGMDGSLSMAAIKRERKSCLLRPSLFSATLSRSTCLFIAKSTMGDQRAARSREMSGFFTHSLSSHGICPT